MREFLQVRYEDGDVEEVLMAAARIRLEFSAGEIVPLPSAHDVSLTAEHVCREAKEKAGAAKIITWEFLERGRR